MLKLALKAGLPLISVDTDDTVNVETILSEIAGEKVEPVDKTGKDLICHTKISYSICGEKDYPDAALYKKLAKYGKVLILVNLKQANDVVFNAGTLPLPQKILSAFLSNIAEPARVAELSKVLSGLSLKSVSEVCMLSMAQYGELTVRGIVQTRRKVCSNVRGLEQVDTNYQLYIPNLEIQHWLDREGKIFIKGSPKVLMPRGLLLAGMPGTGKSLASKYICNQLQVPLYRMDLSGVLGKYVGDSESRMAALLGRLEQLAPCALLIDEVEKLFQAKEDSGVTQRLLSSLLWWLQEHQKPIVAILTTNDAEKLPKELIRPGRLDKKIIVYGLSELKDQEAFVSQVYDAVSKGIKANKNKVLAAVRQKLCLSGAGYLSQAYMTQLVLDALKDEVAALHS